MENEHIIVLENGLIAKFKKSKIELLKYIGIIALLIGMFYFQAFFGRHSKGHSTEYKLIFPTALVFILFLVFCFSKMVSVITIDTIKKELTIEYYQLFTKWRVTTSFNQFKFVVKEKPNQKNSYIKLILDSGKTFTASNNELGQDSINYDRLLELLKNIKKP